MWSKSLETTSQDPQQQSDKGIKQWKPGRRDDRTDFLLEGHFCILRTQHRAPDDLNDEGRDVSAQFKMTSKNIPVYPLKPAKITPFYLRQRLSVTLIQSRTPVLETCRVCFISIASTCQEIRALVIWLCTDDFSLGSPQWRECLEAVCSGVLMQSALRRVTGERRLRTSRRWCSGPNCGCSVEPLPELLQHPVSELRPALRRPWLRCQAQSSTLDSSVQPGWRTPDLEGVFLASVPRG